MATRDAWKKTGLFLPYHGLQWTDTADPDAWADVQDYMSKINEHLEDGVGILLTGPPGRGKTLLANMIGNAVLDAAESWPIPIQHALRAFTIQGYMDLFRRSMNAMDIIRKGKGDEGITAEYSFSEKVIRDTLTKTRFVYIDDIGKEHTTATGYAQHQIERLIRARGNRGLPTILTTNAEGADEISALYDESLTSYLRQVCITVPVGGEDYRVKVARARR